MTCAPGAGESLNTLGGNDSVSVSSGTVTSIIEGTGLDIFNLINGIVGSVSQDAGADTANVSGGSVTGTLSQGDDIDAYLHSGGGTVATVDQGGSGDTATIGVGATIGSLLQGTGIDLLTVNGGNITLIDQGSFGDSAIVNGGALGSINQGTGDDAFSLTGGTVGSVSQVTGADTANVTGGSVTGTLSQGDDVDAYLHSGGGTVATVDQGGSGDTATVGVGATIGNLLQGTGADLLTVNGGNITSIDQGTFGDTAIVNGGVLGAMNQGTGDDVFTLTNGIVASINQDAGFDTANISGGNVTGTLSQGDDGDTYLHSGGGTVATVDQGSSGDTATIGAGATIGSLLQGDGVDAVTVNGGNITSIDQGTFGDTAIVNGGVLGAMNQGTGDDVFTLTNGIVASINQDAGFDTASVSGGSVTGTLSQGDDGDTYLHSGGGTVATVDQGASGDTATIGAGATIGSLLQGDGVDAVTVNGGNITSIDQGAFGDTLTLNGGLVGAVDQGTGNDLGTVNNGTVSGVFQQGDGTDSYQMSGGQLGSLDQGGDFDEADITAGWILGQFTDGDNVTFSGGRIGSINLVAGDNVFTMSASAEVDSFVNSEQGADRYDISGGTIGTYVNTGSNNDRIVISLGVIGGYIDMESGDDGFTMSGGSVGGNLIQGAGVDTASISGGSIVGEVQQGDGADIFALSGGNVALVAQGGDNDQATVSGGSSGTIAGEAGEDSVTWSAGVVGGIDGGIGSDQANVTASAYDGTQILNGGDDASSADGWVDELTLTGVSFNAGSGAVINWELIRLVDASAVFTDLVAGTLTSCNGSTTVKGASIISGDIQGCINPDILIIDGDSSVGANIEGAGGDDAITISGNASVVGVVNGEGPGQDGSGASFGNDTIILNTTGSVGTIDAGAGNDFVDLSAGTTGSVLGRDGNDAITLGGATVLGSILAGNGDDTIELFDGLVATVEGDAGNDSVLWQSASAIVGTAVRGGDGNDLVALVDTSINPAGVLLDGGDDPLKSDGWDDALSLEGWSGSLDGDNTINFEVLYIGGGKVAFSNGAVVTSTDAGTSAYWSGIAGFPVNYGVIVDQGGTLDASSDLSVTGNVSLYAGRLLAGNGSGNATVSISNRLVNKTHGVVDLSGSKPAAGDRLTVDGDYVGGGKLRMDTVFLGSSSPSDRIAVAGDTSGKTKLLITKVAGKGAATKGDGIELVNVGGDSEGKFKLAGGPIRVGAYEYDLFQGGINARNNGDWYLRSSLTESAAAAVPYPQILLDFGMMSIGTLQQRTGVRQLPGGPISAGGEKFGSTGVDGAGGSVALARGAFVRTVGVSVSVDPEEGVAYAQDAWLIQGGYDGVFAEPAGGVLTGGLMATYGASTSDLDLGRDPATGARSVGSIGMTGYGIGANLTWLGDDGLYVDAVGQATWYDSSLRTGSLGTLVEGNNAFGYALSLEAGQRIALGGGWTIVPQAQVVRSSVDFDAFTDPYGAKVLLDDGDSLLGRAGFRLETVSPRRSYNGPRFRAQGYGIANLNYEFLGGTVVNVAGSSLVQDGHPLWGELGLGATLFWNDSLSLYGEASYAAAFSNPEGNNGVAGRLGMRLAW